MTIKDAAEMYGISKQAIYQRLKKHGISLDTIRDQETGELSQDAEAVLENLFGENSQVFNQRRVNFTDELTRLKEAVNRQQIEVEKLTIQLEAAERERDFYRETLEQERALFSRYLPAPGETSQGREKRPGLFRRIAAAIKDS